MSDTSKRGFASMDEDKQREIASKGGKVLTKKEQPTNLRQKKLEKLVVKVEKPQVKTESLWQRLVDKVVSTPTEAIAMRTMIKMTTTKKEKVLKVVAVSNMQKLDDKATRTNKVKFYRLLNSLE